MYNPNSSLIFNKRRAFHEGDTIFLINIEWTYDRQLSDPISWGCPALN
jgi:hypothetical protein